MPVLEVNRSVLPEPGFLIGGEKVTSGSDDPFPHRYAANGEVTNDVPMAGTKEVDAAVAAARKAFPGWRRLPGNERRRLMFEYGRTLRTMDEELRQLQTAENGQAYAITAYNTTWVAELFEYNAGWADKIGGQVVSTSPVPLSTTRSTNPTAWWPSSSRGMARSSLMDRLWLRPWPQVTRSSSSPRSWPLTPASASPRSPRKSAFLRGSSTSSRAVRWQEPR